MQIFKVIEQKKRFSNAHINVIFLNNFQSFVSKKRIKVFFEKVLFSSSLEFFNSYKIEQAYLHHEIANQSKNRSLA